MARRRISARFGFDLLMAGVEAQQVVGLRMLKLAKGGPAAEREAKRMVREKIRAARQLQAGAASALVSGAGAEVPARSLAALRRKMRANRRRLVRGG